MNKTALITGASRGIGQAVAERFRASGCHVLAPTREEMDLSSSESIRRYFSRAETDHVDIVVNNAGINIVDVLENIGESDWDHIFAVNVKAPQLIVQAASPHMKRSRWGRIVNIGSLYASISREGRGAYTASKSALRGLTRTWALELAPYNVLVNALCPGFVLTDLTRRTNTAEQLTAIVDSIPMKRLATPAEIAEAVYFLASEQNSYITGQALFVDGGYLCQ